MLGFIDSIVVTSIASLTAAAPIFDNATFNRPGLVIMPLPIDRAVKAECLYLGYGRRRSHCERHRVFRRDRNRVVKDWTGAFSEPYLLHATLLITAYKRWIEKREIGGWRRRRLCLAKHVDDQSSFCIAKAGLVNGATARTAASTYALLHPAQPPLANAG